MQTLRKKCIRCGEFVHTALVDHKEMIFTCPSCHSVSSLFEERDFVKEEKKLERPEGICYEYLGSDLFIYLDQLPTDEVGRSIIGTSLIMLFFLLLFGLTDSTIFLWITIILGGFGWLINVLAYFRLENRTYEIVINPYQVIFFEKLAGIKRKLKEVSSYEVDRIRIDTKENPGFPGKNKTEFIIQTKQYQQIKPFYHSADTETKLTYLKFLMDTYLNLQERESDIENKNKEF